jgi:formate hydrogenlyase subunit 4
MFYFLLSNGPVEKYAKFLVGFYVVYLSVHFFAVSLFRAASNFTALSEVRE